MKLKELLEIHSTEKFRLPGCDAKKCGRRLPESSKNMLIGVLGYRSGTSDASVNDYQYTRRHVPRKLFRYSNHPKYLFTYLLTCLLTYLLT